MYQFLHAVYGIVFTFVPFMGAEHYDITERDLIFF